MRGPGSLQLSGGTAFGRDCVNPARITQIKLWFVNAVGSGDPRPQAHKRGYDWVHRRLRAKWGARVARGEVTCWRCRKPIRSWQAWDLGHDDEDRTVYRGPEHEACNRATVRNNRQVAAEALQCVGRHLS